MVITTHCLKPITFSFFVVVVVGFEQPEVRVDENDENFTVCLVKNVTADVVGVAFAVMDGTAMDPRGM